MKLKYSKRYRGWYYDLGDNHTKIYSTKQEAEKAKRDNKLIYVPKNREL